MSHTCRVVLALFCVVFSIYAYAWPTAMDFENDNSGDPLDRSHLDIVIGGNESAIPRCDAGYEYDGNGFVIEDPYCHRYGLVWAPALADGKMQPQIDWNPELTLSDTGFRLPTIKELIRLVEFDKNTRDSELGSDPDLSGAFTDRLIAYWLNKKCELSSNGSNSCLKQDVKLTDGSSELKDGYLISSSYADVDGDPGNTLSLVMGIRISDGKVALFEPGVKGGWFEGHDNKSGMLALCLGHVFGTTEHGYCEYDVNNTTYSNAADLSIVPVFALLVKEIQTP
ncbi:hypothetical protein HF888_07265 [Bermanella marisrubri]|uniref:Fibrobacter succinogenes major paralogous domain-containing protein n=1 Tax=Bermanella marisrubri TaxID=207949 RepID=Q1N503_9GAMM|nr:hypothetical protein [Bermanella marisrubri]EAT13275.1 hypothetical protein RED65_00905 [Oceanobacter sp. RED65] [Bermanella marisrubri]QIZ84041.1 hypothetical protein HF888_07265 [Bermanella marisrubri]